MRKPITIPRLHCNQCGWDWTPSKVQPRACPHCKKYNWDAPKVVRPPKKEEAVAS